VRDLLSGRAMKDWILRQMPTPEEILKLFPDGFYDNNSALSESHSRNRKKMNTRELLRLQLFVLKLRIRTGDIRSK